MRSIVSLVLLMATPLIAAPAPAMAPASPGALPRITGIVPIVLHAGINRVARFLPGGGDAMIVEAWRGNGNAHGYHDWMVLTGPSEGNPVGVAPIDDGKTIGDTVRDDPFDGEREIGAVAFARASVDGQPASLVIAADLEWTAGRPLADHELATIKIYRLTANDDIGPPLSFVRIATLRSTRRYCNVQLALREVLGMELPTNYAGPNRIDGCFGD